MNAHRLYCPTKCNLTANQVQQVDLKLTSGILLFYLLKYNKLNVAFEENNKS